MFAGIAAAVLEQPDEAAAHVDLLWTSMALAKHRSVLIDEAIRMVTDVVAARTGTDPDVDVYPHLVTSVAISAIVTAFQFAPAGSTAEPDRTRLLHECFELLRAGLARRGGHLTIAARGRFSFPLTVAQIHVHQPTPPV